MPRKTPASPAAKTAKTAKATKPAPKAVPKAAAPKAAVTSKRKTGVKTAVKAAARAVLTPPAKKTARKAAAPAAAPREPVSEARPVLVRDSFTMPEQEYAVLAEVKQACLRAGIDVKKSELLRIGVALLGQLDVATLKTVLGALPQLKTGRPPAQN